MSATFSVLNPETLSTYYKESLLSNKGYKYSARYGYQTMKAGDRATFDIKNIVVATFKNKNTFNKKNLFNEYYEIINK